MSTPMTVTIVRFPSAAPASFEEARDRFGANAASYLDVPGLLWKAYLRSDDGTRVGGVYWWANRDAAQTKFSEEWRAGMVAKYGAEPEIEWFDAPIVVDAISRVLRVEAPPERG